MGSSASSEFVPLEPGWTLVQEENKLAVYKEKDGIIFSGKYFLLWNPDKTDGAKPLWFHVRKNMDEHTARAGLRSLAPLSTIRALKGADYVRLLATAEKKPGCPAAHLLVHAEMTDALEEALKADRVSSMESDAAGNNILHVAVRNTGPGAPRCLAIVLAARRRPDVNSVNRRGETCLHTAAIHGLPAMVPKLIQAGAQIDALDRNAFTPLHHACRLDREEIVKSLFEWGASGVVETPVGAAIHLCAFYGATNSLKFILKSGFIGVDAKNAHKQTALHVAAYALDEQAVGLSSDWEAVEEKKSLALHSKKTVRSPDERKVGSRESLENARAQVTRMLLDEGCHVDNRDADESTPLHLACSNNLPMVVSMLLNKGASVASWNHNMDTALHLALNRDNKECVRALCQSADINQLDLTSVNRLGMSALNVAEAKNNDTCLRYVYGVQVQQLVLVNERLKGQLESISMGDESKRDDTSKTGPSAPPRPSVVRQDSGSGVIKHVEQQRMQLSREVDLLKVCLRETGEELRKSNERAKALEEKQESLVCAICLEDEVKVAFAPCGHVCTCIRCSAQLNECPLCRKKIESKLRLYGAHP